MSVGIDGCLGKSMIREGKGLDVHVRRSLRDVFKKVPTFSLEVKVTFACEIVEFHCVYLSDLAAGFTSLVGIMVVGGSSSYGCLYLHRAFG